MVPENKKTVLEKVVPERKTERQNAAGKIALDPGRLLLTRLAHSTIVDHIGKQCKAFVQN